MRTAKGEHDPATAAAYAGVAQDLAARGRHAEAGRLLQTVLDIRRAGLRERHPDTGRAYDALAENQHRLAANAPAEALDAVGRELASLDARLSRDNPRYAEIVALSIAQAQWAHPAYWAPFVLIAAEG